MASAGVPKPEVALEQAFAIVNGKKVETSHPQISSTSAVVRVAIDAAHGSTCVQLLSQGPQASGVMSSSGPLAATAGGHATHKFAGLSPGTEYTMRTCVRATGGAADAFSETTTFTTLSKEEAAAQQVEHLTAQRDVALHDLAQVREQTGAHAPPSPQHGQTQAAQAALEAKDGELRAVQATLADAQRRLHRAEALEALLPQLRGGLERMGDSLGCAHSADMSVLELLAAVEAAVQSGTTGQAPGAGAKGAAAAAAANAGVHDEALARNKYLNTAAAKAAGRSMQLQQLHVLPREECARRVAALPQRQLEEFFDKRDLSAADAVLAGSVCLLLGKAASLPQSKALMCDPDVRAVLGDVGTALRPVSSATEEMICKLWTAKEVAHCLAAGLWSHGDTPVATTLAEWVAAVVQHTRAEREGGEGGGSTASAAKAGTLVDDSQSSTPSAFESAAGSGSSSTPNTVSAHVQGYVPQQRPPRELVSRFRGHMKQGLEVEAYAAGRAFFSKAPDPCVLAVRSTQAGERLFWVKNNGEKLGDVLDIESSMKVSEITGVDTGSRASSVLRSKASASDDDRMLSIQGGERTLDLRVADKRTAEWLSKGIKLLIADHRGEIEEE